MSASPMLNNDTLRFDSKWLESIFESAKTVWLGLSGGLDSMVLLHVLATQLTDEQKGKLKALHIHHGLSSNADDWLQFCESSCAALGVQVRSERVVLNVQASLEDAARKARYAVFDKYLGEGDVLLLAHHAGDQLETLLFRLFRGTGGKGLAGIPLSRQLKRGQIIRPFLELSKADLERYAKQYQLDWINDESNKDIHFSRNFLRHQVIPVVKERFPQAEKMAVSAARRIAMDYVMLERFAAAQLVNWTNSSGGFLLAALAPLSEDERMFWLRQFLQTRNISLPQAQLESLLAMLLSSEDRQPAFAFSNGRIMRHQGYAYVLPLDQVSRFGELLPKVVFKRAFDQILVRSDVSLTLRVRPNSVSLVMPNGHNRKLKKWFNDLKIPVWWRDHLPYMYFGEELIAIGSLWRHPDYQDLDIEWLPDKSLPLPLMDDTK